jgi:hypothetical protein
MQKATINAVFLMAPDAMFNPCSISGIRAAFSALAPAPAFGRRGFMRTEEEPS